MMLTTPIDRVISALSDAQEKITEATELIAALSSKINKSFINTDISQTAQKIESALSHAYTIEEAIIDRRNIYDTESD